MSPRAAAEPLASAQRDGATSRKLALERVLHELGDALDQRTTEQPAQAGQLPRAMFRLGIDPHRHPVPPPRRTWVWSADQVTCCTSAPPRRRTSSTVVASRWRATAPVRPCCREKVITGMVVLLAVVRGTQTPSGWPPPYVKASVAVYQRG